MVDFVRIGASPLPHRVFIKLVKKTAKGGVKSI